MASAEAACGGSIPGPGGRRESDTQSAIMQVRAIMQALYDRGNVLEMRGRKADSRRR